MGNASSSASSSPPPPRIPLKSNSGETMQLAEFKDIFDLQQLNRDARSLASISTLCWVRIGQGDFALSLPGNKLLLLKVSEEKTDSTSSSSFPSSSPSPSQPPQIWKSIIRTRKTRPKIPNQQQHANSSYSSYSVDQHVSDHDCLETAIRGWDAWVRRKFSHSIHHLTRRARWRSSKPSGAQLAIISRYISDEQKLESLNKGQAADITMRVMLGGLKQARRVEKLEAGGLRLKHQQYEKLRKQLLPSLNLTHQTNKS